MGEVEPGAEGGTRMTAAGLTVAVGEADWEGGTGVGYATTEAATAEDWSLHLLKEVEECSMSLIHSHCSGTFSRLP